MRGFLLICHLVLIPSLAIAAETHHNSVSVGDTDVSPGDNVLFVRHLVDDLSDNTTVQIQRHVTTDTGVNPAALRVKTHVGVDIESTEWALSSEISSYSNTSSTGFAALSGVCFKYGTGQCFSSHFQVKDFLRYPSSLSGSIVGQELNIQAWGEDDSGIRIGIDLVARSIQDDEWDYFDEPATFQAGLRIRNSKLSRGGSWINGIEITDLNAIDVIQTGLNINTRGQSSIKVTGKPQVAAIDLSGVNIIDSDTLIKLRNRGKIEFKPGVNMQWNDDVDSMIMTGQPTAQTVGNAGIADPLPINPSGYLRININGSNVKIPYYNN